MIGADVEFSPDMVLSIKKCLHFLANFENKQKFIDLLGTQMELIGIQIQHSPENAGYYIETGETKPHFISEKPKKPT